MQMTQTVLILENTYEVDCVFEVTHYEEDVEATDVHFDYVSDYRAGFEIIRVASDLDQKIYNLIEIAALEAFDLNKAKELENV